MTGDLTDKFRDVLAEHISADSNVYSNVVQAFEVLCKVAQTPVSADDDHGITWIVRENTRPSNLDRYLALGRPYNCEKHTIYGPNMVCVAIENRHVDAADAIDPEGNLTHENVPLPFHPIEYMDRYGIEGRLDEFLGEEDAVDGLGTRKMSALYASDYFGEDVVILTLHEKNSRGENEVSVWYRGERIFNTANRITRYDMIKRFPTDQKRQQFAGRYIADEEEIEHRAAA
jgi:hypothetical protein